MTHVINFWTSSAEVQEPVKISVNDLLNLSFPISTLPMVHRKTQFLTELKCKDVWMARFLIHFVTDVVDESTTLLHMSPRNLETNIIGV